MASSSNNPMKKSKRLNTIKKKADELSKLCSIDVCLIGTHPDDESSGPSKWITYPEDPNAVARIVNRYQEKSKEKKSFLKNSSGSGTSRSSVSGPSQVNKDFDVEKALEGMTFEKVHSVRDRVLYMVAEIDAKLDMLKNKQENSDISRTTMGFGLSLQPTLGMAHASDESMLVDGSPPLDWPKDLGSEVVDACATPMLSIFPRCPPMGEVASCDQIHQVVKNAAETLDMQNEPVSEVANKGVKIFGVYMKPELKGQSSSDSAQPPVEPKE